MPVITVSARGLSFKIDWSYTGYVCLFCSSIKVPDKFIMFSIICVFLFFLRTTQLFYSTTAFFKCYIIIHKTPCLFFINS